VRTLAPSALCLRPEPTRAYDQWQLVGVRLRYRPVQRLLTPSDLLLEPLVYPQSRLMNLTVVPPKARWTVALGGMACWCVVRHCTRRSASLNSRSACSGATLAAINMPTVSFGQSASATVTLMCRCAALAVLVPVPA
jgi:hypothetical protein